MRTPRTKTAAARAPREAERAAAPAVITRVEEDASFVQARESLASREVRARIAVPAYRPTEGDRVLILDAGDERYVIGVLRAAAGLEAALPDGSSVRVHDGAAEIRDREGRLRVRYRDGSAEIASPEGDLVVDTPGRVVVRSGAGIALEAPELTAKADRAELAAGTASITAERIVSAARIIAQSAERFEVSAGRLVEKARDVYREATELSQTRAGRMRQLIGDVFSVHAKRTQIDSEDDTSIDGKRVLLG